MKKFYCNGKKDFCDRNQDCESDETREDCKYYNEEGGEWVEIEEGEGEEA